MLIVAYFSIRGIARSVSKTDVIEGGRPALYLIVSIRQSNDENSDRNCAGVILFNPASAAFRHCVPFFHAAKRNKSGSGMAVSQGIRRPTRSWSPKAL